MRLSETQVDPSPFIVETIFNVRYAETDAMGIVHHSAYVVWLEEGRSAWFRERLQDAAGLCFDGSGWLCARGDRIEYALPGFCAIWG